MLRRKSSTILLVVCLATVAHADDPPRPYVYRVLAHQVTDGDTIRTLLDLGFDLRLDQSARLDGLDAPENSTPAGKLVTEFVRQWAAQQQTLIVESTARDKFAGRYVARLYGDQACLNDLLLEKKLARLYDGGTRDEWPERRLQEIERLAREAIEGLRSAEGGVRSQDSEIRTPNSELSPTVWVTNTGKKYHAEGCRFLDQSRRQMPLDLARRSYEPCKVCTP